MAPCPPSQAAKVSGQQQQQASVQKRGKRGPPKSRPGMRKRVPNRQAREHSEEEQETQEAYEERDEDHKDNKQSKSSKRRMPSKVTIPWSDMAKNFSLPPGYRRCTRAELTADFQNDISEPLGLPTAVGKGNYRCDTLRQSLYHDISFRRRARLILFQRMKLEIPDLEPFHHLLEIPEKARQLMEKVNTCMSGIGPNECKISQNVWCSSCDQLHRFTVQSGQYLRLALARNKAEFDAQLLRDTECSHLCHWALCANPFHSVQEPPSVNSDRNVCMRLLVRLLKTNSPEDAPKLAATVRDQCTHGSANTRCFSTGSHDLAFPTEAEAHARDVRLIQTVALQAGFCHEHKLDLPIHLKPVGDGTRYEQDDRCVVFQPGTTLNASTLVHTIMRDAWRPLKLFGPYTAHFMSHHVGDLDAVHADEDQAQATFDGEQQWRQHCAITGAKTKITLMSGPTDESEDY